MHSQNTFLMADGMPTWLIVVLIVVAVIIALLVVLYIVGSKLQRKQQAQKEQMDAMAQTVSIMVIDKKIMRMSEANLPKQILDQTPKYMRRSKLPFVKAKIGPKIMVLIADKAVFEQLPTKKEVKVVVSGIYITAIKSVRGGAVPQAPAKKKKGLFGKAKS